MTVRGVRFYFSIKVQIDINENLCDAVLDNAREKAVAKLQLAGNPASNQLVLESWEVVEGPEKEAK
jgi:hypothetical protein